MATSLAHLCFVVPNLARAEKFYRDKLGLKHAFDFRNDEGRKFGVYLHVGGRSFIELFEGKVGKPAKGQSYQHLCLEVKNIKATVKRLRQRRVQVTDIKLGCDQSYQAWLSDPDGNRIELHQYTRKSWQAPHLR